MYVNEEFRTRILVASQGTGTAGAGYLFPTPGVNAITVRIIANINNAADLTLTLKSADDTTGTNAANFTVVPAFINGVRQAGYESTITITQDSGNVVVDFEVMPGQVPEGKSIGIVFGESNAANIITAELFEDVAYVPSDN